MSNIISKKRVLVAPLNWGLGHVSRCFPIIDSLIKKNVEPVLASDGEALAFLRSRYPSIPVHQLPSYNIRYAAKGNQSFAVARQIPHIRRTISHENQVVKDLVSKFKPEIIISDNRYGVWHEKVPSIFLGHQLSPILPTPFEPFRGLVHLLQMRYLRHFSEIWVPDLYGEKNLTGSLSQTNRKNKKVRFIHPISRFANFVNQKERFSYPELSGTFPDILAILSGPEPQRSMFQEKLTHQAGQSQGRVWIVEGKPVQRKIRQIDNLTVISIMHAEDLELACRHAHVIISRSGYSSIMDFSTLEVPQVVFVPTPGQSEQEYLGKRMEFLGIGPNIKQDNFELEKVLSIVKDFQGFQQNTFSSSNQIMPRELDRILGNKIPSIS